MEKSTAAKGLPVAKAVYSFMREKISPSFHIPGWNKGRIVCHRSLLKRLPSVISEKSPNESTEEFVSIANSSFPSAGTRLYTTDIDGDDDQIITDETMSTETEEELMTI